MSDPTYDTVLQLRLVADTMQSIIMDRLGPCREAPLALTKVDEALMWAKEGVLK